MSRADGWRADGWRARHYVGSQFYAFSFDPEGNAVSRQNSGDSLYDAYATSTFEAYGSRGGDFSTASGSHPASHQDPVRFGGQWGYYTDYGTGLLCLTHRYYDPGTGKFVNRDPIGYGGGMNLYGFAGGNPVNEMDPNGTLSTGQPTVDPLNPEIERAVKVVAPRVFRIVIRRAGMALLRAAVFNPVTLSVGLFFVSQTRVADDSTGPGSPYYIQQHSDPAILKAIERQRKKLEKEQLREARAEDANPVQKAADILAIRAAALGYTRRLSPQPFSHGQTVFSDGDNYISKDVDAHNVTNGWKMFDKKGNRLGTYDSNLNRIKR